MSRAAIIVAALVFVSLVGVAHAAVNARTQALTTAYLGSNLTSSAGTQSIELGCLDAGALVACTLRVTDAAGDNVEYVIPADNVWSMNMGRPRPAGYLAFNVKAAAGTPTLQILEY